MDKIKVGIVDDEKLFIKGMKSLLEHDPELKVTLEASNGVELIEKLIADVGSVDVILLDLAMSVMDGVDTLLKIINLGLPVKIIILTSHYNDSMIIKLLDEGAMGFLAKNEHPSVVIDTIKGVYNKSFHINDHILQLIRNRRLVAKKKNFNMPLSSREIEVLRLICQEQTNKEIADQLFISPRTVEGHRKSILEKTQCKNTVGLVIYAIEHNLLEVKISKYL